MKRFSKLFVFILCAFSAVTVASCLSSDDDGGIDPAVYKAWMTYISGSYYGDPTNYQKANKIYFWNDTITGTNKTDSIEGIEVAFRNDSTLSVYEVPGSLFKNYIKDNDELKEALDNAPSQTLTAKYMFYNISSPNAWYYVAPSKMTFNNLNYNGGTHSLEISFYGLGAGVFVNNSALRQIQLRLVVGEIKEDGVTLESPYGDYFSDEKLGKHTFIVYATR